MASAFTIRKGAVINYEGNLCVVQEHNHVKPGKGPAYVQLTIKNLRTQKSSQVRLRSGEDVQEAHLETKSVQFLYKDETGLNFMALDDYNTFAVKPDIFAEAVNYLKENMEVELVLYEESPISIELPTSVNLRVVTTMPGIKGDSVTNIYKPATLETGYEVQVPLFVNEGDTVKVDTRTGDYLGRA